MLGYNRMTGYNVARYNAEGTEISKADTVTVTDATVTKNGTKQFSELTVLSETIAKEQNKSVTDTIRLDAWLRLKKDQAGPWGD